MIIIRLAGTSGSGKTTLVRQLMEKRNAQPILWPEEIDQKKPPKIRGYNFEVSELARFGLIIGRYNLTTGGADIAFNSKVNGRNSMERLQDEVQYWAEPPIQRPVILFEGLIVTSVWGRWAQMAQEHPEYGVVFAFLDTPLDTCRANVAKRNQNKPRSGDPVRQDRNLRDKFETCQRQIPKGKEAGLDIRMIRYEHGLEDLEMIIDGAAPAPPPAFVRVGDRDRRLDEYL